MKSQKQYAERLYAGAITAFNKGDYPTGVELAREAVEAYERLNIQTLEDALATRQQIDGVLLPELMHEGVVKARLKQYGVRL